MRVLLDENLPHDLASLLMGHQVKTVAELGWHGVLNGELLARAAGQFDAFVTMDRRLPQQQDIARLPFGVLVIRAASNRMLHLQLLLPAILQQLSTLTPGTVASVGA